jgi:hypothetical protein
LARASPPASAGSEKYFTCQRAVESGFSPPSDIITRETAFSVVGLEFRLIVFSKSDFAP